MIKQYTEKCGCFNPMMCKKKLYHCSWNEVCIIHCQLFNEFNRRHLLKCHETFLKMKLQSCNGVRKNLLRRFDGQVPLTFLNDKFGPTHLYHVENQCIGLSTPHCFQSSVSLLHCQIHWNTIPRFHCYPAPRQTVTFCDDSVAECVFLPARWRYVVVSAYCNPSHFFCDPSHLPVIWKVCCAGVEYVGGTSLVLVLINFLLQPLTTCD